MDRRTFLQNMAIASIAIAVPVLAGASIPKLDNISVNPVDNSQPVDPYEKYKKALEIMDSVLMFNAHNQSGAMHTAFDRLYEHIHATFAIPDSNDYDTHMEIVQFMNGSIIANDELIRKLPPAYTEIVWPVAMMKILLRNYELPINHRKLKQFKVFHDRYGYMMLYNPKGKGITNVLVS